MKANPVGQLHQVQSGRHTRCPALTLRGRHLWAEMRDAAGDAPAGCGWGPRPGGGDDIEQAASSHCPAGVRRKGPWAGATGLVAGVLSGGHEAYGIGASRDRGEERAVGIAPEYHRLVVAPGLGVVGGAVSWARRRLRAWRPGIIAPDEDRDPANVISHVAWLSRRTERPHGSITLPSCENTAAYRAAECGKRPCTPPLLPLRRAIGSPMMTEFCPALRCRPPPIRSAAPPCSTSNDREPDRSASHRPPVRPGGGSGSLGRMPLKIQTGAVSTLRRVS